MTWDTLVAGFGGGLVRGLVGFIKHQYAYKSVGFNVPYFVAMVFLSGVVGMLTAALVNQGPSFAFIVGYAGGDFIENAYKILAKKPSLYPIPTK